MSTGQGDGRPAMTAEPLSGACTAVVERGEHACFGISPFNSYFSTARIREPAAWGLARFERVDFFVPDAPSSFTFEALGYAPQKAAWKARRQGQYTRNKIASALSSLGFADPGARVLGWTELESNAAFGQRRAVLIGAASLMLSFGIGMLSGGLRHFEDFPDRGAVLASPGDNGLLRRLRAQGRGVLLAPHLRETNEHSTEKESPAPASESSAPESGASIEEEAGHAEDGHSH